MHVTCINLKQESESIFLCFNIESLLLPEYKTLCFGLVPSKIWDTAGSDCLHFASEGSDDWVSDTAGSDCLHFASEGSDDWVWDTDDWVWDTDDWVWDTDDWVWDTDDWVWDTDDSLVGMLSVQGCPVPIPLLFKLLHCPPANSSSFCTSVGWDDLF